MNNVIFNSSNYESRLTFDAYDVSIGDILNPPEDPSGYIYGVGEYLDISNTSENSWIDLKLYYENINEEDFEK